MDNPGKGFAFVSYSESSEVEATVKALDSESVLGKVIQRNIARFKKHIKKKKDTSC